MISKQNAKKEQIRKVPRNLKEQRCQNKRRINQSQNNAEYTQSINRKTTRNTQNTSITKKYIHTHQKEDNNLTFNL